MRMSHSLPLPSTRPRAGWRLGLFLLAEVPLLVLLFLFLAMVREARGECPKLCECKWRDGKETVSCPGAAFIDIPRRLDHSTQVLDLTRNNLQILPRYAFQDAALLNLQKVWLPFCNLKHLQLGSFKGLSNLVELDLSDNLLKKIPVGALQDVGGLRELRIGRNRLSTLPSAAFSVIPDLIKLDLSENMISNIVQDAFKGLSRLEVLRLGGNRLSTLTVETLKPLVSLHGLHLHDNPWRCNCHLRPLRRWMLTRNVAEHVQPTCSLPVRLHGREWQSLTLDEFVCMPSVTAVAPRVLAAHGDNVSLACKVETDLNASVTWLVGDRLLENATETGGRRYVQELVAPDHNTRLSNLTIAGAAMQDQGTYRCVAENKAGRVETNLTLQVSKEILEVPLVAIDKFFMAGAVLGGGGIFIAVLALLYAVFFRRRNLRRRQRRAKEELQSTLTSAGSLSGTHSSSRIHLNSIGALHDEDEGQGIALTEMRKHPKLSDYHIVATSEVDSSPMLPEASSKPWVVRDSSLDDFVLSKDMEKVYNDKDADRLCEQHEDFEHRKSSSTSSASPRKVSYIEIPKPELARENVDEKAKWKDIAYQSKEVALKRDLLRQQSPQQAHEGSFVRQEGVGGTSGTNAPLIRSNSTGGSANFPDLLDLPQTQAQQSQVEGRKAEGASPSYNNFPPLVPRRQRPLSDAAVLPRREDVQRRYLEGLGIPPGQPIGEEQRSTSTLALPLLDGGADLGAGMGECSIPGTVTKDATPVPHRPLLRRHPSLPTSPLFEDAQALRELLATHRADYLAESSRVMDPADPYRYEYHAAQLDKFLQEYKNLQEQLYRMKESCEHMRKSGASSRTDDEGAACPATTSAPSSESARTPFDYKDLPAGGAAADSCSIGGALRGSEGGKGDGAVGGTVGGSLRPSGSGEPLKSILKNRNEGGGGSGGGGSSGGGGGGGGGIYHLGNFGDDRTPLESAEEATAGFSREDSGIKHQDFEFYNS